MTTSTADIIVLLAPVDAGAGALLRVAQQAGIPEALPSRSRATRAMLWLWRSTADPRPDECVSFSYSRDWIGACIGGTGTVGLDLEARGDVPPRVARRIMTAADERRLLARAPGDRDRAAATHWCASEAVAKACGAGLPMLLGRRTTTGLRPSGTANGVWFKVFEPLRDLTCAVAGTAERGRIRPYRLAKTQAFEPLAKGS